MANDKNDKTSGYDNKATGTQGRSGSEYERTHGGGSMSNQSKDNRTEQDENKKDLGTSHRGSAQTDSSSQR